MAILLPYTPPLDWDSMLEFLELRAITGVEWVEDGRYHRTVRLGGSTGTLAVGRLRDRNVLELDADLTPAFESADVVARVRRLFDLDTDPDEIAVVLGRDPLLAPKIAARPGLRVPGAWDGFELAVRAVLGQQVTVRGAATIAARIVAEHGAPLERQRGHRPRLLFPAPEELARADLAEVGLTRTRAETVREVARAVLDGRLEFEGDDWASLRAELTAIRGIGEWTAGYVAMRALRDPDAFPTGDLVLRKAAGGAEKLSAAELASRAERWRPWRAYAAVHLWRASAADG